MRTPRLSEPEARLLEPPEPGRFGPAELEGLPEPAQRHLAQAIAPGTPLVTSARLRMRGHIKVGRWLPFRAHQLLNPHNGFVWTARAAGVIAGSDRYLDGDGGQNWKLLGLLTVAHAEGPDVSRSAAGRAGAEAIWLPTALLPRFGVRWSAGPDGQVTAGFRVGDTPLELQPRLDVAGRIASLVFDRWGDPDNRGAFGWYRFGGEFTGYRSFQGLTIPSQGRLGWFYGQDRWPAGEFFRTRSPTWSRSPARPPILAGDRRWFGNRLADPLVRLPLRSALHRLLSRSLVILSYQGRKTGRWHSLPLEATRPSRNLDPGLSSSYLDAMERTADPEAATLAAAGSRDPELGLRAVAALRGLLEVLEALQVDNARANGWSWQAIASRLGVTKQAVHQKHGPRSRTRQGR